MLHRRLCLKRFDDLPGGTARIHQIAQAIEDGEESGAFDEGSRDAEVERSLLGLQRVLKHGRVQISGMNGIREIRRLRHPNYWWDYGNKLRKPRPWPKG